MNLTTYAHFFQQATGHAPYPYQNRLAERVPAVLDVATGLGKTEATVLPWLYRLTREKDYTPRRLIYCLPMRSLVEQTADRIRACFARLASASVDAPGIDVVLGGDVGERWLRNPELPYVVVGTQDMLLSRALNRGYGMIRFQWPMAFGAVNDDAYWVIDEVQLQGIGAVTATQLQAFRERFGTFHRTEITLTSATIDESWFETADFTLTARHRASLTDGDLQNSDLRRIITAQKLIERSTAYQPKDAAALAHERHRAGTRTIVVVNRVVRAQEIYHHLKREHSEAELVLLHSRYRPGDRANLVQALLADVDPLGPGRIIIATQILEAGIDVSAATLITDVAPWSSLVQRFGRANRRGDDANVRCIWLDGGETKKNDARPYEADDLTAARLALLDLEGGSGAPADLPKHPIPLRKGLVIRKPEFLDLFDTSQDLSGHDVDVSPYIRDADDVSVSIFWRDVAPNATDVPQRQELCPAPVSALRDLIRTVRAAGRNGDVRLANQFAKDVDNAWTQLHESEIRPGATVWLHSDLGWYDSELGFGKVQQRVPPIEHEPSAELGETCPTTDSDVLSAIGIPITLTRHARDTERHAREITAAVALPEPAAGIAVVAALWHDVGKAHEVFQETMRRANSGVDDNTSVWAKGMRRAHHGRRGFRHELPGALAYLHMHDGEANAGIIAYLVAAHHGKLRVAAQQLPYEASSETFQLLGTRDGEVLPAVDLGEGTVVASVTLSLAEFRVGSLDGHRAWIDRTIGLRDDKAFGPFRLAYLELLVRLADWRASEEEAKCR